RRTVAAAGLAVAGQAGWRSSNSGDALAFGQKCGRRKSGEDVDAEPFGFFAEPADDLADRGDVVAVVLHRRRRGDSHRAALGHVIDALAGDRSSKREILILELRE